MFHKMHIRFPDCIDIRISETLIRNNNLPFCHSEVVRYMEFLSGLVDDKATGIVSREDLVTLWDLYNEHYGGIEPAGKSLFTFLT